MGSVSERDDKPWYLERCSSTLTSTYSSGDQSEKQIVIIFIILSTLPYMVLHEYCLVMAAYYRDLISKGTRIPVCGFLEPV